MDGRKLVVTGVLNWPRLERQSDRYGSLIFSEAFEGVGDDKMLPLDESDAGKAGRLVAKVVEARRSPHIGDLFRGIFPQQPDVGEEIVLGEGTLFFEPCDDGRSVGVQPADGRDHDWMDPNKLYRAIHQTVELYFVPQVA